MSGQRCTNRMRTDEPSAGLVRATAVADLEALATKIALLREGEVVAFDTADVLLRETKRSKLDDAVVKLLGGDAAAKESA